MGDIRVQGLGDGTFNVTLECDGIVIKRKVEGMQHIEKTLFNMLYEMKCNE